MRHTYHFFLDLRVKRHKSIEMSLTHVPDGPSVSELPALLRQWMGIQDKMTELNTEVRGLRAQGKVLKEVILRIMEKNRVAALNVSKGTVVHKVRESAEALTDPFLMKHCKDFFNGDEDRARALVEYLNSHRATKVTHDLKLNTPKGDDDSASRRS